MLGIGLGLTSEGSLRRAGGAAAWDPVVDLGASLKLFLSADDHGTARMTDDGAGLISSWTSKVGVVAVAGTTTARPTWAATSFNSAYAGLTCDGVANALTTATLTGLPTGATAGEIWVLASNTKNVAGNTVPVSYGSTVGTNIRALLRTFTGSVNRVNIYDGTVATLNASVVWAAPSIIGGFWAGTVQDGRQDGSAWSGTGTIATLATAASKLAIGARCATTLDSFHLGVIRHVFITTTLTALQRQQLEGWMAWDAGLTSLLPAGHPYKSARP